MKTTNKTRSLELNLIERHHMMGLYWSPINERLGYTQDMPANRNYWVWEAFMHEEGDSELIMCTYPVSDCLLDFKKEMPKSLDAGSVGNLVLECAKKGQGLDKMYWLANGLAKAILEEERPESSIRLPEGKFVVCIDHIKRRRLKVETHRYIKEDSSYPFR